MNALMAELRTNALATSNSLRCLSYRVDANCVQCGGRLHHRADGTTNGREARALAVCSSCGHVHMIAVTVTTVPGRPIAATRSRPHPILTDADIDHGTDRGYYQHRGISPTCTACRDAHNEAGRRQRAARRGDGFA